MINLKVKPVEVMVPNHIKTTTKSNYQDNYSTVQLKPTESGRNPDCLKGGQPWLGGGSIYKQLFQIPNPEKDYNKGSSDITTPVSSRQDSRISQDSSNSFIHQYCR